MCRQLTEYKDKILFRFTIGASNNRILNYWEPGAPDFEERLECLQCASKSGYRTSVSMEPVLDWGNVIETFHTLEPFVTDSIWLGTMNNIGRRVDMVTAEDMAMVANIGQEQNGRNYQRVHGILKDHPLVRWKESLKEALNLKKAEEAGLDI